MVCCVSLILNCQERLPVPSDFLINGFRSGRLPLAPAQAASAYNVASMIPEDLFELMACPVCIKPLVRKTNPEALQCSECHRVYPVRDGLAVMLIDQATIEPS